jgi:hypothetical protein
MFQPESLTYTCEHSPLQSLNQALHLRPRKHLPRSHLVPNNSLQVRRHSYLRVSRSLQVHLASNHRPRSAVLQASVKEVQSTTAYPLVQEAYPVRKVYLSVRLTELHLLACSLLGSMAGLLVPTSRLP